MNYHQLKQWLQNNWKHGENNRRNSRLLHGGDLFLGGKYPIKYSKIVGGELDGYESIQAILTTPPTNRIWGIDLSHWNKPPVNLKRMKELYGLSFVIIKGHDGSIKSNYFEQHVEAARLAGIPWMIYDWLYPGSKVSIDAQTTAWANQYKAYADCKGVFIDAEWTNYGGQPANPNAADLRTAHDKFRTKAGRSSGTYTAKGYADQYLKGFVWKAGEPLWVAHYGVNNPALPAGATTYQFWQFTSTLDGKLLDPNGNAELDGNHFNGTAEQFAAQFGTVPNLPTGETPMPVYKGTVITSGLRMRVSPSTTASVVLSFALNDKVEAVSVSNGWWHIVKRNNTAITGYAYEGDTKNYIRTDSVETPLPVDDSEVITKLNELIEKANFAIGVLNGLSSVPGTLTRMEDKLDSIKTDTMALLNQTPTEPQPTGDGYTGPRIGVYEVIDVPGDETNQQWGGVGSAVPLFDSDGGNRIQIAEKLHDHWMATLEGYRDLLEKDTIVTDETGKRFILGKAIKGQKLLIATQGKSNGIMRGSVIGFSNENDPQAGIVNYQYCTPENTPWAFNKITNVRRFLPIMSGNKGNRWWIPMSWLRKVS